MRKLASAQRVLDIVPIPNADRIEIIKVLGYNVISQKGIHAIGDLVVYVETDSIPPNDGEPYGEVFNFLWQKYETRPANYRIQFMTMRGVRSQGIVLSMSHFPNLNVNEGDDLTETLGIKKWEPKLPNSSEIVGEFMPGVPKTDEERAQSNPVLIEQLRHRPYIITEKADGASMTLGLVDDSFAVFGRNYRLREEDNAYWRAARWFDFESWLRANEGRYALQGELVGPGSQKNGLGLAENKMLVFNVVDTTTGRRLSASESYRILPFDMPCVKVIETGPEFNYGLETLLEKADGLYEGTENPREGIVVRAYSGDFHSFKIISHKFEIWDSKK